MIQQPSLFPELENDTRRDQDAESAKVVVRALISLRKKLKHPDLRHYYHHVDFAIRNIRSHSHLSGTQREALILNSIENQQATSLQEIAEDTRISILHVKQIVLRLCEQDILEIVPRMIPGNTKPIGTLILSKRQKQTEAKPPPI